MNRAQKRALVKRLKKRGMSEEAAKKLIEQVESGKLVLPDVRIVDGDKVKLNTKTITSREAYPGMQEAYREFVEANTDTVFTVNSDKPDSVVVGLEEEPRWRFYTGDLIRVSDGE